MLQAFREGNQQAFDTLFRLLYPALSYFGCQVTQQLAVGEEIAAEAFVKVWKRRAMFTNFNVLKSYLYTIVKNDCIDWLKQEARRKSAEAHGMHVVPAVEPLVWENMIKAELMRELMEAIHQLPPQRQRVIKMLYEEGKSVKQVATELQVSLTAIKLHKKAGLVFLRKMLPLRVFVVLFMLAH
ncbi:MAG TPA: sigma-70 family RNA polymerase sigma factor [Chitinophagaceae bacterium]|nr:sigma-70 family RNA polymerase sigma factor [Chitinophagaceae bacterium]